MNPPNKQLSGHPPSADFYIRPRAAFRGRGASALSVVAQAFAAGRRVVNSIRQSHPYQQPWKQVEAFVQNRLARVFNLVTEADSEKRNCRPSPAILPRPSAQCF